MVESDFDFLCCNNCFLDGTHPPLKAPTGFFTGGVTTASCSNDGDVLNDLERKGEGALKLRLADASLVMKVRDAMVAGGDVRSPWLRAALKSLQGRQEASITQVEIARIMGSSFGISEAIACLRQERTFESGATSDWTAQNAWRAPFTLPATVQG